MEHEDIILAVSKMQDYMDKNSDQPISLHDLAQCAGYSPYYASRLFKELVGKTPFEYLRLLRLSKAALMLRDSKPKIIDVALEFVFASHEGFTRSFHKEFGLPPQQYRHQPIAIPLFMPHRILDYYRYKNKGEPTMEKQETTKAIFVQVVNRPRRKLILKRGKKAEDYFAYCEEVGCDVWGVLVSIKEALYEPIGLWLPPKLIPKGTSCYVQGVEVPLDYNLPLPVGFECIELEPAMMMVFQGEPYPEEDFEDAINEVWQLIDRYRPELYGYEWADDEAPRFQLAPQGYRGYIEARPVRFLQK